MIDFRYHIVSLISVFLALAVGIALGAGPLQGTIGDQLTEQIEQLRTDKDALRADLEAETARAAQDEAFIDAASPELLDGVLPRSVAVVGLPGAEDATVEAVIERLQQAGATVTARVAVTSTWTDAADQPFRASLVGNLSGYLDPAPAPDASTDEVLGSALAQALTSPVAEDPTALSPNATLLLEVLTAGELVTVPSAPGAPADAVVVVAPPTPAAGATPDPNQAGRDALVDLVVAFAAESQGTVVGGPSADSDLVAALRGGDAAARVATVDGVSTLAGQVSVPRALAAAIAGTVGHYGFAGSAQGVLPPVVALAPVVVEPAVVEPAEETAG